MNPGKSISPWPQFLIAVVVWLTLPPSLLLVASQILMKGFAWHFSDPYSPLMEGLSLPKDGQQRIGSAIGECWGHAWSSFVPLLGVTLLIAVGSLWRLLSARPWKRSHQPDARGKFGRAWTIRQERILFAALVLVSIWLFASAWSAFGSLARLEVVSSEVGLPAGIHQGLLEIVRELLWGILAGQVLILLAALVFSLTDPWAGRDSLKSVN